MMTEYEARELTENMHRELNAGPGAVRQCVAGLLIFIVILLIGTVFPPTTGRLLDATNATAGTQQPATRVEPDERPDIGTQALRKTGKDLLPVASAGEPKPK